MGMIIVLVCLLFPFRGVPVAFAGSKASGSRRLAPAACQPARTRVRRVIRSLAWMCPGERTASLIWVTKS